MVEPSKNLTSVFDKSIKDAQKLQHEYITLEHLVYALFCEEGLVDLVKVYGADVEYIKHNLEHHLKTNVMTLKSMKQNLSLKKLQL